MTVDNVLNENWVLKWEAASDVDTEEIYFDAYVPDGSVSVFCEDEMLGSGYNVEVTPNKVIF